MSDNIELRRKQNDYICRNLPDNVLPISPVKMFECEDDDSRREQILKVCYDLIDMCDEVWFYDYNGFSDGQICELGHALSKKLIRREKPPKHCIDMGKINIEYNNEGWI